LDLWFNPKQYQQAQGQRYILFDSPLSLRDVAITATFFFCLGNGILHLCHPGDRTQLASTTLPRLHHYDAIGYVGPIYLVGFILCEFSKYTVCGIELLLFLSESRKMFPHFAAA